MNITVFIAIIAAANILSFAMVAFDKNKSIAGSNRVPEVYFFFWSIFFSSLGVLLGMYAFRHKVRKPYFTIGITLLLLEQALLTYLLLIR